jgi:hypothetical protein
MKKFIVLLLATMGLTFAGFVSADGSGAGIVGSPHDFADDFSDEVGGAVLELGTSGGWNLRNEICRVCHVPHDHQRASQRYLNGLLWNHGLSSADYTMYSSSTLDGAQSAQPDGIAKLCLGCHDGTVAIDTFDKFAGTAGNEIHNIYAGGLANFRVPGFADGTNRDLRGTHPISIVYDPGADGNLNAVTATMGTSGTIADVLDNDKVQCSSCHDVHDQESVAGTHLLRVAQKDMGGGEQPSGLCLTCHIK